MGMAKVGVHLPRMCKVLISNPSINSDNKKFREISSKKPNNVTSIERKKGKQKLKIMRWKLSIKIEVKIFKNGE
jgi:hypothetical protein